GGGARAAAPPPAGRAARAAGAPAPVPAPPPARRTEALAKALTADGYAATARNAPVGEQLCQHHCPVAHVAEQYPQLCEAETEFFSRLLGTHVQRLATIAHGDGVCTTFIPHSAPQTTESASVSTAGRNPA
ncbi:helix-turn-helix transcriptional regulator, partial [Streptomyces sp. NPDC057540]|uniref:helix-turn-helix transcriptional regulator n=1 Tax=Streptomyces sp. NPDC057540 TaxID=3346160 RepID=UPI0036B1D058